MIDSQNSLEQKKYFFHLMDKFMEKFRIRGVVAYSFLHLSIVEYYYMDPAIRCILVWSVRFYFFLIFLIDSQMIPFDFLLVTSSIFW